jgi:hypothetical protein
MLNYISSTPWRRMRSGCIDPHFLDLGISWRWEVSSTPRPFYHRGNSSWYPLDRRLGGLQSRSGRRGENSWLHRDSNSDPSAILCIDYAILAPIYIYIMKLGNNVCFCPDNCCLQFSVSDRQVFLFRLQVSRFTRMEEFSFLLWTLCVRMSAFSTNWRFMIYYYSCYF